MRTRGGRTGGERRRRGRGKLKDKGEEKDKETEVDVEEADDKELKMTQSCRKGDGPSLFVD